MASRRPRLSLLLTVFAAAGALAVASAPAGATSERHACTPGVRTVNGVLSRVFCGPAKATVRLGAGTLKYANGVCERRAAYVAVNVGVVTLGQTSKPRPAYFGLVVGRYPGAGTGVPAASRDGVYKTGITVTLVTGGKGVLLLRPTVTLKDARSRGTFTATTFAGARVSGSFSCG